MIENLCVRAICASLCCQCHVFSKGYLYERDMPLDTVQYYLRHLTPESSVTLLRHKGLADWIHTTDHETPFGDHSDGEAGLWVEDAMPGDKANRLEQW